MMFGLQKLCNAVYWLALTLWISALVAAGIAAVNVFGTLTRMAIEVKQYGAIPPEAQGRLAAGKIMEGVFFTCDMIQVLATPLVVLAMVLQFSAFRSPLRSPSNIARLACVTIAAGIFAFHATTLAPTMNRELRAYWSAAEAGELGAAETHLAAFNRHHPLARGLMQTNLVLLIVSVVASAAALGPQRPRDYTHIPSLLKLR